MKRLESVDIQFQIGMSGSYDTVRLLRPAAAPLERSFDLDQGEQTQFGKALQRIEEDACSLDDIQYVGNELWLQLSGAGISDEIAALRKHQAALWLSNSEERSDFIVRLDIPDKWLGLPWESLYDRNVSTLAFATRPRFCIVHHPPAEASIAPPKVHDGRNLTMLVIAPENTQLNVTREVDALRAIAESRGVKIVVLDRRVTANKIHDQLAGKRWDIVHYIGHGEVNADRRVDIAVNDESGERIPLNAELLCNSFRDAEYVRLAVFNCCRGSGDPETNPDRLTGLGPMLMRKGVPAVVSMRYEIADYLAFRFAERFYDALLRGPLAGRVDVAMTEGRTALSRESRASSRSPITPVLHLAPGYHRLFDAPPVPLAETVRTQEPLRASPPPTPRKEFDSDLAEALASRRCIPIVGPGVLRAGISRDAAAVAPPGPLELIRVLTQGKRSYPCAADLELAADGNVTREWMQYLVLQWVCQYHGQTNNGWIRLADDVCKQYARLECPPLLYRLASVPFPALFYTWYDGLFHQRVASNEGGLNEVVTTLSTPRPASDPREKPRRPLILLRGSVQDPVTLVLTEDDHERLSLDILRMSADLAMLARAFNMSLLFIGLSPREPLVRVLIRSLLGTTKENRKTGPAFFHCTDERNKDDAYWAQFNTRWIIDELDPFLEQVIEAAK